MISLVMVILSIALLAAMLSISVNYLPAWQGVSRSAASSTGQAIRNLRAGFAGAWRANGYTDPPSNTALSDGGLGANFAAYTFLPGAPPGYTWMYGRWSAAQLAAAGYPYAIPAGGLSWFCMYPTAGTNPGVYRGIRTAIQNFGGGLNQVYFTAGGGQVCGQWVNSPVPASFPANYALTLFVRCTFVPGPSYTETGAGDCQLQ